MIEHKINAAELVAGFDAHIIGQAKAKKLVAIAAVNRHRRAILPKEQQKDIAPKNILLVGPSGVGKTEIARRLAAQVSAPFAKVEATKFTEVGYVGQDVEKIIKDLVETTVRNEQDRAEIMHRAAAEEKAFQVIAALLDYNKDISELRQEIADGNYDKVEVEVDVPSLSASVEIIVPPGLEEMTQQIEQMFKNVGSDKVQTKKVTVPQAFKLIVNAELERSVDSAAIVESALDKVENYGIVFLDEIDKLIARSNASNSDVSRGGVQRDLLPLLEGTLVSTKYGQVATDHILFIASGAFIDVKPTDLASELQGRLPVVVELADLTQSDLQKILVEPSSCLVNQYKWLMSAESVKLEFSEDAIALIAKTAYIMNREMVNLGARRLAVVIEKVLEDVLFDAHDSKEILIDAAMVAVKVKDLVKARDDARWVL